MPGLVNAHVHLELTALRGKIPFTGGFRAWVRELLARRDAAGSDRLLAAARTGAAELLETGTLAVGEISTLGITRDLCRDLNLAGVWFREVLGMALPEETGPDGDGGESLRSSLAAHAPHTTAPELLASVKSLTRDLGLPMSIHLAESLDESEFIRTGTGPWAEFLQERGIRVSDWPIPSRSPVAYLDRLHLLDPLTLAVHLLDVDDRDLDILERRGCPVVVCPRSNLNLHGRCPDIPHFLARGFLPALGTDSPASVDSLSLFDEMAFVASRCPGTDPRQLLAMATTNGARALGMEALAGTLDPGKPAFFIYLPLTAASSGALLERIIGYDD
jgi:cytosine/adenosine deaminase-related metal-dependent hydrolase